MAISLWGRKVRDVYRRKRRKQRGRNAVDKYLLVHPEFASFSKRKKYGFLFSIHGFRFSQAKKEL